MLDDAVHAQRCLAQLRSKDKAIEKYIYLSQLKDADPSMFYRMCLANMAVCVPGFWLLASGSWHAVYPGPSRARRGSRDRDRAAWRGAWGKRELTSLCFFCPRRK